MSSKGGFTEKPKGDFAPGAGSDGVVKTYTPEEAKQLLMERNAYENETEAENVEDELLDDEEIESIRAELKEDDEDL